MFLSTAQWSQVETYLLIDRKLSASKGSLQSLKSRFYLLAEFFTETPFNRDTFNTFILGKKNAGHKPAYLNNFIKMAKHVDKLFKINEMQDYTYFREKKNKYDVLTPEEIAAITAVDIPYLRHTAYLNQRNKTFISFLAQTGCRISEALEMTWDDLIQDPIPTVTFRDTKNGEDREIPIPRTLCVLLHALPKNAKTVFDIKDDTVINEDLQRRAKLVGITKRVWCHLLRHSYITNSGTIPIEDLSFLIGHRDIKSTMHYKQSQIAHFYDVIYNHPMISHLQTKQMTVDKVRKFLTTIKNTSNVMEETESTLTIRLSFPSGV